MASRNLSTFQKIQAKLPVSDEALVSERGKAIKDYAFYRHAIRGTESADDELARVNPYWSFKKSLKIYSRFHIVNDALQKRLNAYHGGPPDPTNIQARQPRPQAPWRAYNSNAARETRFMPTVQKLRLNLLEHVSDTDLFNAFTSANKTWSHYFSEIWYLHNYPEPIKTQFPGFSIQKVQKIWDEFMLVSDATLLRFNGIRQGAFFDDGDVLDSYDLETGDGVPDSGLGDGHMNDVDQHDSQDNDQHDRSYR